jgi:nicotinate-nucleotide adenylyltransferase
VHIVHGDLAMPAASSLGVLSGTFHPVTAAHLALARSALANVTRVLFVMPERLPHKEYEGVGLDARLDLLCQAAGEDCRFAVATTKGGLFTEIAAECRSHLGGNCDLWFLCGRDAAERFVCWNYGDAGGIHQQLEQFGLLVAPRQGRYDPPPALAGRIQPLSLPGGWDAVSATEVRHRIARGEPWRHLVPAAVADQVARLYSRAPIL